MAAEGPRRRGPLPNVTCEVGLLLLALEAAARAGDLNAEVVQHVSGTRGALATLTGPIVHSAEPSYMVAIRGNFVTPCPFPPGPRCDRSRGRDDVFPVKLPVVAIQSGQITDSGTDRKSSDLAQVSPVATDYRSTTGSG